MDDHQADLALSQTILQFLLKLLRPRIAVVVAHQHVVLAQVRRKSHIGGRRFFLVRVLELAGHIHMEAAALLQFLLHQRGGGAPVMIVLAIDQNDADFLGRCVGGQRGQCGGQEDDRSQVLEHEAISL